ncbi:hypothetical protein [Paenibacillus harenae]|nr:hypothetical protein [Paenibacillus harenae]
MDKKPLNFPPDVDELIHELYAIAVMRAAEQGISLDDEDDTEE